ncbi:MAG: RpiB/LacA/LacB family sugar-phosphate isomerase [Candidatus Cloacimonetes bacterium]|nr:RpiB/LacA/LacB family sugar-phosphate isomerase [Candidatus Cloacimonadota bacterium]
MKIALASDHAGFEMKVFLKKNLVKEHEITDIGTFSCEPVDYAPLSIRAAEEVAAGRCERAVIICGTGIGSSIAANKVKGIRAALCHCKDFALLSREHNNANVLVLPGRFIAHQLAAEIVSLWLATPFSNAERHIKRIEQIKDYEERR